MLHNSCLEWINNNACEFCKIFCAIMMFINLILFCLNKNFQQMQLYISILIIYVLCIFILLIKVIKKNDTGYNDNNVEIRIPNPEQSISDFSIRINNYIPGCTQDIIKKVNHNIDEDCVICLEKMNNIENNPICQLNCKHYFHKKCITNWINHKQYCPICRINITSGHQN